MAAISPNLHFAYEDKVCSIIHSRHKSKACKRQVTRLPAVYKTHGADAVTYNYILGFS